MLILAQSVQRIPLSSREQYGCQCCCLVLDLLVANCRVGFLISWLTCACLISRNIRKSSIFMLHIFMISMPFLCHDFEVVLWLRNQKICCCESLIGLASRLLGILPIRQCTANQTTFYPNRQSAEPMFYAYIVPGYILFVYCSKY